MRSVLRLPRGQLRHDVHTPKHVLLFGAAAAACVVQDGQDGERVHPLRKKKFWLISALDRSCSCSACGTSMSCTTPLIPPDHSEWSQPGHTMTSAVQAELQLRAKEDICFVFTSS